MGIGLEDFFIAGVVLTMGGAGYVALDILEYKGYNPTLEEIGEMAKSFYNRVFHSNRNN